MSGSGSDAPTDGEQATDGRQAYKPGDRDDADLGKQFGQRHLVCFLSFLGLTCTYAMRVDLSVAVVSMVNHTYVAENSEKANHTNECNHLVNTTQMDGPFQWLPAQQSLLLGAFFWGYIIPQIPGGYLADRFGGKRLFGSGILACGVLTIIFPLISHWSFALVVALRVLQGLVQGVIFPSNQAIWSAWAPPLERSRLIGYAVSGASVGTFVALPLSGLLASAFGWPSIFYVIGVLSVIWACFWFYFVGDRPETCGRISAAERHFITSRTGQQSNLANSARPPIGAILSSPAVWAILIAHATVNWEIYTLLTTLPTYFSDILGFNIRANGFVSAIPYIASFICVVGSGRFADYLIERKIFSVKRTRKLFQCFGQLLAGGFLVLTGYVGCSQVTQVTMISLSTAATGMCMGAGYQTNHVDIAPAYAGLLFGMSNMLATVPGFVGPEVVGFLTDHNQTSSQWRIVFYITAGVALFGAVFFGLFAEGTRQPWAGDAESDDARDLVGRSDVPTHGNIQQKAKKTERTALRDG